MVKYKTEFKIEVVKECLEGSMGCRELAKKYLIPAHFAIRIWVNTYEPQGYEGLGIKRKNSKYSLELKLNTVNLYLIGETSYQSLANELKTNNLPMVARWIKEFKEEGIERLELKKRGRPSNMLNTDKNEKIKNENNKVKEELSGLEKLRKENYYLQMEVDILKKRFNSHRRQNQK